MQTSQTNLRLNIPAPQQMAPDQMAFRGGDDSNLAIEYLEKGHSILIYDYYHDGILLLRSIHDYLQQKLPNKSFNDQRIYRSKYQQLSNLLLVEVKNSKLNLKKAPEIGWLERFYPNQSSFLLTFPQVQGLNSSWQWYKNGIQIPVLKKRIHPFYGVYFPTRFEHLILFDEWVKNYKGPKKSAIDVGVGCGVLSLQLLQSGFGKVYGTDINPNAIYGLEEVIEQQNLHGKLHLDFANLFGQWDEPTELIVFNPPWLPAPFDLDGIDEAIYYDQDLFPNFFRDAIERLLPNGKLLLIFSNLAQITKVTTAHPILEEIENGGRFKLVKCYIKTVKSASSKTIRNAHWRTEEEVELWELKPI